VSVQQSCMQWQQCQQSSMHAVWPGLPLQQIPALVLHIDAHVSTSGNISTHPAVTCVGFVLLEQMLLAQPTFQLHTRYNR
jgi:hypothetical protein